jgi:multicomponent Na+:H+ antiporter subunit B
LKIIGFVIVLLTGSLMLYATQDFPPWGDPNSPASLHVSPRYLEKSVEETAVPNVVTAVLADYRGFDTMFETTVIFCAGVTCFLLLRIFPKENGDLYYRHRLTGVTIRLSGVRELPEDSKAFERIDALWTPYDLIVKNVCCLLIPFIQLFALYVIAHGHHSPGGGFQGGVMLGASAILFAISHDLRAAVRRIRERTTGLLCAAGVFIYAGTGAFSLLSGRNFLDYAALAAVLRVDSVMARSHGIFIVEIGVGIAVMATMIWIYNNVASAGKYDEGL